MVIDTSALVAILIGEPSRESLLGAAAPAARRIVSAVSLLEAGMVLRARYGEAALPLLYELIDGLGCEVAVFDPYQAHPERFVRSAPKSLGVPQEVWINKPSENKTQ